MLSLRSDEVLIVMLGLIPALFAMASPERTILSLVSVPLIAELANGPYVLPSIKLDNALILAFLLLTKVFTAEAAENRLDGVSKTSLNCTTEIHIEITTSRTTLWGICWELDIGR